MLSDSQKVAVIVVGILTGAGAIAGGVYAILTKLQIINKKIDPRKIRNFPKF